VCKLKVEWRVWLMGTSDLIVLKNSKITFTSYKKYEKKLDVGNDLFHKHVKY
jgi:hypothetical protein